MADWKITKDRTLCEKPGCPLPSAPSYYVVLEVPSCLRRDLCESCFKELPGGDQTPIFWKAERRADGSRVQVLDLASLRILFDRLGEQEGEQDGDRVAGLRYFVALLLLRKRVLKMADPQDEEQERADLLLIDPKLPEMEPVALFAPGDLADLEELKQELLAALADEEPAD